MIDLQEDGRTATVLIVEDHTLLADGLALALRSAGMQADVIAGPTPDAIVERANRVRPDVVLLEIMLGDDVGLAFPLIEPLCATGAAVLVLTGETEPRVLGACIEAGACGLASKTESLDAVLDKILRAARRQVMLSPQERDAMLASLSQWRSQERDRLAPFEQLTQRERVVLGGLMDGASAEEIARASMVSLATVRTQIRSILEKLGVHSQVAAVAAAHRARWQR